MKTMLLILTSLLLTISIQVQAKDRKPSSQKVIDFDGETIEGLNKQPLDTLSDLSEGKGKRKKTHLYRKRKGFRSEDAETARELGYVK